MKKTGIMLIFLLLLPALTFPQFESQTPGTTGADFLKIGVGARQAAMGNAFTAIADDATAIYWNPGGLGFANRWNINMAGNRWLFDTWHGSFFASKHICVFGYQRTALGLGAVGLGMPNWNSTSNPDAVQGKANDLAIIGSVGQRIDWLSRNLSIGISGKYIQRTLADESANGLGMDGGLMFRAGRFKTGLAVTNYTIQKVKFIEESFKLPTTLRGGMSLAPARGFLLAVDVSKPIDNEAKIHSGAELWVSDALAVRLGYKAKTGGPDDIGVNDFSGFTAGLGLRWKQWQFDYAFSNYDDIANDVLNATHQFSISLRSPNALDPFSLKSPPEILDYTKDPIILIWEHTFEHDRDRPAHYLVVMDGSSVHVQQAVAQFEQSPNPATISRIRGDESFVFSDTFEINYESFDKWSEMVDGETKWYFEVDGDTVEIHEGDTYYWTVLALEPETMLWRVCKQRVGQFTFGPGPEEPDPTFKPYK
ncbi:MAG: PorV/PorQ family protein [Gemmatimonadota bacterium]|nr:MAG: PorV/PorQ family protein [Gemmatimonadota bacterium]